MIRAVTAERRGLTQTGPGPGLRIEGTPLATATSRLENLKNLQTANVDVAFASAFGTLVGGTFLIGFIQFLGGGDYWVQLMVALPSIMGLMQIPGAVWGRAYPHYKRFIAPGGWVWRLLYAPLIVLPLLALSGDVRLVVLAVCVLLATAAVQIVSPIYNDWIAELVPANSRGWYFARRTAISTAVAMAVAFLGGVMLDHFRALGREATGFSLLFGLGFVCAIVSMVFFLRMQDTVRAEPIKMRLRDSVGLMTKPLRDSGFQKVLWFTVLFMVGATFAGGLYAAFALESLKLSYTQLQLTQVAHAVGTVAAAGFWGRLADKYGNKPVLVILMAGVTFTPAIWLFCQPGDTVGSTIILTVGHVYNGIVWSGVAVCQLNLFIATSDEKDRANYLGMALAVQALVGGIAPMVGAFVMNAFRGAMPVVDAYKTVFWIVIGIRVLAWVSLLPVREEGAVRLGEAIGQLRRFSPRGARALAKMSKTADLAEREEAMATVGAARFTFGADELLKALGDPSPRVRRQAAAALAKLQDPGSSRSLIKFVQAHPELVEEETLEALGDLQAGGAVPVVARFLQDPRSLLRRQAAKTLGRLGSTDAVLPLCQAAGDPADPELRRAAIQALRLLGATEAAPAIADALLDPHPSVRTAAAEAVGELELKALAPRLREALAQPGTTVASEIAYALGCVGTVEDAPLILAAAAQAPGSTIRRRCLLGLARLFGVEAPTYRLMMLDGFSRDTELMAQLRPAYSRSKRLREAVQAFSRGDEAAAVRLLGSARSRPELAALAESPVEESFLIAALVYAAGR